MKSSENSREWLITLTAIGIVFGDIGTSPLYALRECFHGPHAIPLSPESILGILSLMFWALILVVSFKYLQVVTFAHNKGEGGILALTALACMHKKRKVKWGNPYFLALGLFGTALLVGDGMITPAISVMSAMEGLKVATPVFSPLVLPLTILVLVGLFAIQKYGTQKIGTFFGPVMILWFFALAILGGLSIYQSPEVLLAINPIYGATFLINNKLMGFFALGSVFLVCTGGEALYADMGHFGRTPIKNAWYCIALPSLALNYFGQGALLLRDPSTLVNPFYYLAPDYLLYPLVGLAAMATIIASQALISGLFSLAKQCVQLGYCPRLNIVHTSSEEIGQIYVPPINWLTLAGTLWLVIEFKSSSAMASAYGICVALTMTITTILASVVARIHWRASWLKIGAALTLLLTIDLAFLAANLLKLGDGGWVTLTIAVVVFILMTTWFRGRQVLMQKIRSQSYPFENLIRDIKEKNIIRVPGCAVFMVGDAEATPPPLIHNLKHNKVLHETVVFLTVVTHNSSRVPENEQVEIIKLAPGFIRLIGHYGFMQSPNVTKLLAICQQTLPDHNFDDITYFLGREVLTPAKDSPLSFWRSRIFGFLSRNARTAYSYYNLPMDRVIEVGTQVEI